MWAGGQRQQDVSCPSTAQGPQARGEIEAVRTLGAWGLPHASLCAEAGLALPCLVIYYILIFNLFYKINIIS